MTDIVDRLVRFAGKVCLSTDTEIEAASEIERLRAENEKLRAALKRWEDTGLQKDWPITYDGCAAAALKETEHD